MTRGYRNQAGGNGAAADRSMTKGPHNQAGGNSAPLRRSGRAAVTSQHVSSAVSQLADALISLRRLSKLVGTSRDRPYLRLQIHTTDAKIEEMVKDTSYQINKFLEPNHYDGVSPSREIADAELAKSFAELIGQYQEAKKYLPERENATIPYITQRGEGGVPQRPRPIDLSIKPQLRARPPQSLSSIRYGVEPPASCPVRPSLATSSSNHHHSVEHELISKGVGASVTTQKFKALMNLRDRIRNVCLIAHADKGKSAVADLLMEDAGVSMVDCGDAETGITSESTAGCLLYELNSSAGMTGADGQFLINLFESNYHCDSEPIRMSDGIFLVIDSTAVTIPTRTENVLKQALCEGLIPVLVLDNFEQYFEVSQAAETAYVGLSNFIEEINNIISEFPGGFQFHPEKGTVAFCSSKYRWAFALSDFAEQHASDFEVNKEKMMQLLWGENFYDTDTKKWTREHTGSQTCKRGFVRYCYDPIKADNHPSDCSEAMGGGNSFHWA